VDTSKSSRRLAWLAAMAWPAAATSPAARAAAASRTRAFSVTTWRARRRTTGSPMAATASRVAVRRGPISVWAASHWRRRSA
jgi:hypothetical protein